jgi:hypothetical protein
LNFSSGDKYERETSLKEESIRLTNDPTVSRPRLPAEYGVPKNNKGLLPWSHVTERMPQALHYWICTVGSDNRPHVTPVDEIWLNDKLYYFRSSAGEIVLFRFVSEYFS